MKLKKAHYEEILAVENGADIMGYGSAKLLREVEKVEPSFIRIVDAQGNYDPVGRIPYFGAIATKTGVYFAKRRLDALSKKKEQG